MASNRPAPSKRSKGKPTPITPSRAPGAVPRAHRSDTPEAIEQRRRAPKTHFPARTPGATRKD